ncbi:MAG TPA: DUF1295 domain-containing protein [Candidatus Marinimicrobia bacterium]|nr:DUF1295 domain-containing protein [Candidatus Neomarinimicrobiota bacterium]
MLTIILNVALSIWIYMSLFFLLAVIKEDNSIADIGWGLGFVIITIIALLQGTSPGMRGIVYLLVILWGLRLSIHIYLRNRGRGEDYRYAKWRQEWGKWLLPRSYFQIFILQGLLMIIIAYPVILIASAPREPLGTAGILGTLLWLLGFYFEVMGDLQLLRFKKDPDNKGKIIQTGLWRYTRHPNYFGEVVMWWGIFLLALPVQSGWTAVISPLLITYLLLKVSGVPMLEKKYAGNVQFELYKQRTCAFFPWFPKKPWSINKHT